jgi:hypothetical protein
LVGEYPDRSGTGTGTGFTYSFAIRSDVAASVRALTILVTFALVAAAVVSLPPPVRRRAHAILSAGAAGLVVERFAEPRFGIIPSTAFSPRVMAVLAAAMVLGIGMGWIVGRERLVPQIEV